MLSLQLMQGTANMMTATQLLLARKHFIWLLQLISIRLVL